MYLVEYLVLQTVIHQLMVNSQNLPPTRGTFLPPARAKNVHARIGYTEDSLTIHVNSTHPSKSHYLTKVLTNSSTLPFKNGAHAPPSRPWLPRQCRRSPLYAFKHCPLPIWKQCLAKRCIPLPLAPSDHLQMLTMMPSLHLCVTRWPDWMSLNKGGGISWNRVPQKLKLHGDVTM